MQGRDFHTAIYLASLNEIMTHSSFPSATNIIKIITQNIYMSLGSVNFNKNATVSIKSIDIICETRN